MQCLVIEVVELEDQEPRLRSRGMIATDEASATS